MAASYKTVRKELKAYGGVLIGKKEIVALNKCDALTPELREEKLAALTKASRKKVMMLSGVSGEGRTETLRAVAKIVAYARNEELPEEEPEEKAEGEWTP